jgi:hypothetical protein
LAEPKIFRVFVSDGNSIFTISAIEHEGKLWLVPHWLESKELGLIMPARIISLENLQVQDLRNMPNLPTDFSVGKPIPKAVFDGRVEQPEAAGYVVVERPPIRFRKPTVH